MNEKQWKKKQWHIANLQKQMADDAKMVLLGVPPKPPKPSYVELVNSYKPMIYFDTNPLSTDYVYTPANLVTYVDSAKFKGEMKIAWDLPVSVKSWSVGSGRSVISQLASIVPSLTTHVVHCPVIDSCEIEGSVADLIPHLNDWHTWTREAIADWLDTLDIDLTVKPKEKETQNDNDHGVGKEVSIWTEGPEPSIYAIATYAAVSGQAAKSYWNTVGTA